MEKKSGIYQIRNRCRFTKGCIPNNHRKIKIDNEIYESISKASYILNIHKSTIVHRLKSNKNLKYTYL